MENNQLIVDMLYFIVYAALGGAGAYFGKHFVIQAKGLTTEIVAPVLRNAFNAGSWLALRVGARRAAVLDAAGELAADVLVQAVEDLPADTPHEAPHA